MCKLDYRDLWRHLEDTANLLDRAAHFMMEKSPDDNSQYLATKSLLISAKWKFAHESEKNLSDVPEIVQGGGLPLSTLPVHLPGI